MLQSKAPLFLYEVDLDTFKKTLDKDMGIILRNAIREWLRVVITSVRRAPYTVGGDSFPVQTGAAKAALKPVARIVRMALSLGHAPKRPNETSKGEASARLEVRDDKSDPFTFIYRFSWGSDLVQWVINESNAMGYRYGSRTPWNAIKKADKAFEDTVRKQVRERLKAYARNKNGILRIRRKNG